MARGEYSTLKLYRVQGYISRPTIEITDGKYINPQDNDHLFVSKSLDHHDYYLNKRIVQFIQREVLTNTCSSFYLNWKRNNIIEKMYNALINYNGSINLSSLALNFPSEIVNLVEENSLTTKEKINNPNKYWMVRKVDELRLDGGYHFTNVWLKLIMDSLLYIEAISLEDVAKLYKYLLKLYNCNYDGFVNIAEVFKEIDPVHIYNPLLFDKNGIDIIVKDIKEIMRKQAYLSGSSLDRNPKDTIDNVISCYENEKNYQIKKTMKCS